MISVSRHARTVPAVTQNYKLRFDDPFQRLDKKKATITRPARHPGERESPEGPTNRVRTGCPDHRGGVVDGRSGRQASRRECRWERPCRLTAPTAPGGAAGRPDRVDQTSCKSSPWVTLRADLLKTDGNCRGVESTSTRRVHAEPDRLTVMEIQSPRGGASRTQLKRRTTGTSRFRWGDAYLPD